MFETRVLRKTLAPKNEEMMGDWGNVYNDALCDLYTSPSLVFGSSGQGN